MTVMDVAAHKALINRMVASYVDAEVDVVPDVAEWCASHVRSLNASAMSGNPSGKALWNCANGPNRILLRSPLTDKAIEDHLLGLYLRGFKRVYGVIQDDVTFLKHLILHEVAHIKHNWGQDHEIDCDKWAFKELKKWR